MMNAKLAFLVIPLGLLNTAYLLKAIEPGIGESDVSEWYIATERSRNAVAQVWTRGSQFNWLEPYKSPDQRLSSGTAFFIDAQGHMLTNYHVVAGAKSVVINIQELGRQPLDVTIVGVCPDLDVALLKLTDESCDIILNTLGSINALEFANSDELYDTQRVMAQGYPLGFHTIKTTDGGVAGRDFHDGRSYVHITASINPGNSGGPLFNKEGKVVGIVTASMRNAQNYNYIVPINDVLIILQDLYHSKLVRRPYMSINVNRGTETHAHSLGNPLPAGLYINQVYPNSMEEKAGIQRGDMLYQVKINGKEYTIDEFGEAAVPWRRGQKIDLDELLSRGRIGEPVVFVVYRSGQRKELKFTFDLPALPSVREIYDEYEPEEIDYEMFAGMVIMQLRENHVEIFETVSQLDHIRDFRDCARVENRSKPSLVITSILGGSQAHLCECLSPSWILDKVNGKTVTTLKELRDALMLSVKTNEIAIDIRDKRATVLDLTKVLKDEERLSRSYIYPITDTVKKLMALSTKKTK